MTRRHRIAPEDWRDYYARTGARLPRETLLHALDSFDASTEGASTGPGFAVDLGCGGGCDTAELLRRGWRVLAVDAQQGAIESVLARADLPSTGRLETLVSRYEDADWPEADLINSSFALPLCPPDAFTRLWPRITASLRPGGRFAGQLFGVRDSWFGDPTITFHTSDEAEALFRGFAIELFREEEEDGHTPRGRPKHWHIFHVTARRPA